MLPSFVHLVKAPELPEDDSIRALVRIIRWQARFLVLLFFFSAFVVASHFFDFDLSHSSVQAQAVMPFAPDAVQYKSDIFSDNKRVRHGSRVFTRDLLLTGQVYDIKEIREAWPSFQFLINGAEVPLNQPTGTYTVEFYLSPGANIIETSYRINGKEYHRRQVAVTYAPYQPLLPMSADDLLSGSAEHASSSQP